MQYAYNGLISTRSMRSRANSRACARAGKVSALARLYRPHPPFYVPAALAASSQEDQNIRGRSFFTVDVIVRYSK